MSDNTVQPVATALQEVTQHPHGTFGWAELYTTDYEAAKRFYADLFGWTYQEHPPQDGLRYAVCLVNDKPVGGLMDMPPGERQAGVPSYWGLYVFVDDLDAAAARVAAAGGMLLGDPFDVPGAGRFVMIRDATGAQVGLWQIGAMGGTAYSMGPGVPVWHELWTHDVAGAAAFYEAVLGWRVHRFEFEGYDAASCYNGEKEVAMVLQIREEWRLESSMWALYFGGAVDAGRARVLELGGSVVMEPKEIEGMRFALFHDPQGAVFYIVDAHAS